MIWSKKETAEEHVLSTFGYHELNWNQIALGNLSMSVIDHHTIPAISSSSKTKNTWMKTCQILWSAVTSKGCFDQLVRFSL